MNRRPRIYYTESQKALMWKHWQKAIRSSKSLNYLIATIRQLNESRQRPAASVRRHGAALVWRLPWLNAKKSPVRLQQVSQFGQ